MSRVDAQSVCKGSDNIRLWFVIAQHLGIYAMIIHSTDNSYWLVRLEKDGNIFVLHELCLVIYSIL